VPAAFSEEVTMIDRRVSGERVLTMAELLGLVRAAAHDLRGHVEEGHALRSGEEIDRNPDAEPELGGVWVRMTPCPRSPLPVPVNDAEVFQVVSVTTRAGEERPQVLSVDAAVAGGESRAAREHPEVPLSLPQRDAAVTRLGYRRVGPWSEHAFGRSAAMVTTMRIC
jgi:hypothetical protein